VVDERPLPSGDVTFMFTDVEGSTRLLRALGEQAYRDALNRHYSLLRDAIARHRGAEVRTIGDAIFAAFADAGEAVRACADIQRAFAAEPWPSGLRFALRIGLHRGPALAREGDYVAMAVHQAARVAATGHGGQIVVSDTVRDAASLAPGDITLVDLGRHRLKDFDAAVGLHQVSATGLAQDFPPLRTLGRRTTNLPARVTPLLGRDHELDEIAMAVAPGVVLTLVGPGGVGKTSLAIAAARRRVPEHRDGVWLVELASTPPGGVEPLVAASIGVTQPPGVEVRRLIVDHLRDADALLVLDNVEHVVDVVSPLVSSLLRDAPDVTVLVTSRAALHLDGEHVVRVDPLAVPRGETLEEVRASAAAALFVARAGLSETFEGVDHAAVARICTIVDGLPLAVEIAAAQARTFDVATIAERVGSARLTLESPSRDRPARHRSLDAALRWGHSLLSDDARLLLARLSVFAEPRPIADVREVCAGAPLSQDAVMTSLAALVDQSFVTRADDDRGRATYGLLETIRAFAATDADPAVTAGARDAHRRWLLALADTGGEPPTSEVATAVDAAATTSEREEALRIALATAQTWLLGTAAYGVEILSSALQPEPRDRRLLAEATRALAYIEYTAGDARSAEARASRAIDLFAELDDSDGLARALAEGSHLAHRTGDDATARARAERALAVLGASAPNDAGLRARLVLSDVGPSHDLAEVAAAASYARAPLVSRMMLFEALRFHGEVLILHNRIDDAAAVADEAAAVAALIGRPLTDLMVLCLRGSIALARGERTAATLFDDALGVALGSRLHGVFPAYPLERRAAAAATTGDVKLAARLLGTADAERRRSGAIRERDDLFVVALTEQLGRAALGDGAFTALRTEGTTLDLAAAIALCR